MNTTVNHYPELTVKAELFDRNGKVIWNHSITTDAPVNQVKDIMDVPDAKQVSGVYFLKLTLSDKYRKEITRNIYWLTNREKDYTTLASLPKSKPKVQISLDKAGNLCKGTIQLTGDNHISFFNRIKVFDKNTGKRILPVHYSDNYVTLMPGDKQVVTLEFESELPTNQIQVVMDSWTDERRIL